MVRFVLFALFVFSCFGWPGDAEEGVVISLSQRQCYPFLSQHKNVFVKFFTESCAPCKKIAGQFSEAAAHFGPSSTREPVFFVEISCEKYNLICQKNDVKNVPHFKLFRENKVVATFEGDRDASNFIAFVNYHLFPDDLPKDTTTRLTEKSFMDLFNDKKPILAKFAPPWCAECQTVIPEFNKVAELFSANPNITVTSFDCEKNVGFCKKNQLTSMPEIDLFIGKSRIKFSGNKTVEEIVRFVNINVFEILPENVTVIPFNPITLKAHIKKKDGVLVKFFAPWCGHCKALAPKYVNVSESYIQNKTISIGEVNCDDNKQLCQKYQITGYPRIMLFRGKHIIDFKGNRNEEAIINFVETEMSKNETELLEKNEEKPKEVEKTEPVISLTSDTFNELTKKKNIFVKFYAPWCGHCKKLEPVFLKMGQEFLKSDKLFFGQVDCDAEKAICEKQGITGFPTLKLFVSKKSVPFEGERTEKDIYNFLEDNIDNVTNGIEEAQKHIIPAVQTLNSENANQIIQNKNVLILFCIHLSQPCQTFVDLFLKNGQRYRKNKEIVFSHVDCLDQPKICIRFSVTKYPTMLLLVDGKRIEVPTNLKTSDDFDNMLFQNVIELRPKGFGETNVVALNDKNFKGFIKQNKIVFVKFFAPWCGHCKKLAPIFIDFGRIVSETKQVICAEVDCDANQGICAMYAVNGFPTLKLFNNGAVIDFSGDRDVPGFAKFIANATNDAVSKAISKALKNNGIENKEAPKPETPKVEDKKNDTAVLSLTNDNFSLFTNGEKPVFVKFFAPWCGHCKQLAPIWEQYAKDKVQSFIVAEVDCVAQKEICTKFEVKGYPTLKLFKKGEVIPFSGQRTPESFDSFISKALNENEEAPKPETPKVEDKKNDSSVLSLTNDNFSLLTNGEKPVFVKFFAPWCGHCKKLAPIWEQYAKDKVQSFIVAEVDCVAQKEICTKFEVKGYPTLKLFKKGEVIPFSGQRTPESFDSFIAKNTEMNFEGEKKEL